MLLSCILSIGPIVQEIVINLLVSGSSNIYDSLNEGIIKVLKISYVNWLIAYFFPIFLYFSIFILFVIRNKESKELLFIMPVLIFLTLMITDYCFTVDNNIPFYVNIIPNFLGSFIISLILMS